MKKISKWIFKKIVNKNSFIYHWVFSRYKYGLSAPMVVKDLSKSISDLNKKKKGNVVFVQIGANDGVNGDLLYDFIIKGDWSGILVEPMPDVFNKLKHNFSSFSHKLLFENCAISNSSDFFTLYYVENVDGSLPEWVSQLSSFSKEVLLKSLSYYPQFIGRIRKKDVQSLTFADLLEKHRIDKVDLLSIDTEGFDFEILKTIDFDIYGPAMVIFEISHLTGETFKKAIKLMRKNNYRVVITEKDCMAYKKELVSR